MRAFTVEFGFLASLSLCAFAPGAVAWAEEKRKVPEGVDPKMTSADADYGYSKKKPIKLGAEDILAAPKASRKYLDALRDEDGKPVKYARKGSVGGEGDSILDLYVVMTSAGKELKLYIDMYHPKNEPEKQPAPKGLYKAALAAPVPKEDQEPTGYYPTQVGAKWVYRISDREETHILTEVKEKKGTKVVVIAREEDGEQVPCKTISLTPQGMFMLATGKREYETPVCLLKLPAKAGDEWEVRSARNEVEFKLTATVRKGEKVKVPAGTFEAVPVVLEGTVGGRTITATQWYASGVGLVKVNQGDTTIQELKSFSLGKK